MNRKQIYFLSPNTGATGSPADRKAVAAARSEARSHAAKVSYPPGFRVRRISINSKADAGTLHPGEPRPGPESSQSDTCSDDSCAESARATDSVASENSKGKLARDFLRRSMVGGDNLDHYEPHHSHPYILLWRVHIRTT